MSCMFACYEFIDYIKHFLGCNTSFLILFMFTLYSFTLL